MQWRPMSHWQLYHRASIYLTACDSMYSWPPKINTVMQIFPWNSCKTTFWTLHVYMHVRCVFWFARCELNRSQYGASAWNYQIQNVEYLDEYACDAIYKPDNLIGSSNLPLDLWIFRILIRGMEVWAQCLEWVPS